MVVTLKDVAAEAGVSPATVSYTLRGGQYVSEHTSKKVREAADRLGYTINVAARNLRYGRTGVIETVVRGLDLSSFYAHMVTHVRQSCEDRGYQALFMQTEGETQTIRNAVSKLNNQSCDGILLDAGALAPRTVRSLSQNRPIVLLDDLSASPLFDTIYMPRDEMSRMATQYLIDIGCRNIALIGAPQESDRHYRHGRNEPMLQYKGFMSAMNDAGLSVTDKQLVQDGWRYFKGVDIGHQMIREGFDFDGAVCVNDSTALGLIRGLADGGVQVPRDLKVIGIDGVSIGEFTVPRLTTIAVDMVDLAEKGIGMLVERIEGKYDGKPRRMSVKYSLKVKESCGEGEAEPVVKTDSAA